MHLVDRVEWDLTSSLTPEAFATQMCCDLGLGGESVMLIAHAIHEELLRCKKDCLEAGLVGAVLTKTGEGGAPAAMPPVIVGGNRAPGPRRLESVWRDWNEAKSFGPHVEILTPEDIVSQDFPCACFLQWAQLVDMQILTPWSSALSALLFCRIYWRWKRTRTQDVHARASQNGAPPLRLTATPTRSRSASVLAGDDEVDRITCFIALAAERFKTNICRSKRCHVWLGTRPWGVPNCAGCLLYDVLAMEKLA